MKNKKNKKSNRYLGTNDEEKKLLHIIFKILIYYIHTEKYSQKAKSYVVNFPTQISSIQSEERTMVFTREKNDTSNQKPQRCASFAPKFPPFIAACSAASHTFNEKSFTQRVFLAKKSEKHFGNRVE